MSPVAQKQQGLNPPGAVLTLVMLMLLGMAGCATTPSFDPTAPAELAVRKSSNGYLFVRPAIDGVEYGWFLLDTGAYSSVVNERTAKAAALRSLGPVKVQGAGGYVAAVLRAADSVRLGNVSLSQPEFLEFGTAWLEQYITDPVDGYIGNNVLGKVIIDIDVAAGTVSLHDPAAFKPPADTQWQMVEIYNRAPYIHATFEGHEGLFLIDTGSTNTSINAVAVRNLKLLDGRKTTTHSSRGIGSKFKTESGMLEWFEVGGQRFEKLNVFFDTDVPAYDTYSHGIGIIGVDTMANFRLVLDYPHQRAAFLPRKSK